MIIIPYFPVLQGELNEILFEHAEDPKDVKIKQVRGLKEEQVAYIDDTIGLHQVYNPSDKEVAISLHIVNFLRCSQNFLKVECSFFKKVYSSLPQVFLLLPREWREEGGCNRRRQPPSEQSGGNSLQQTFLLLERVREGRQLDFRAQEISGNSGKDFRPALQVVPRLSHLQEDSPLFRLHLHQNSCFHFQALFSHAFVLEQIPVHSNPHSRRRFHSKQDVLGESFEGKAQTDEVLVKDVLRRKFPYQRCGHF